MCHYQKWKICERMSVENIIENVKQDKGKEINQKLTYAEIVKKGKDTKNKLMKRQWQCMSEEDSLIILIQINS